MSCLPSLHVKQIKAVEVRLRSSSLKDWQETRLRVILRVAQKDIKAEQIATELNISRKTVFNYRNMLKQGGVRLLLSRKPSRNGSKKGK